MIESLRKLFLAMRRGDSRLAGGTVRPRPEESGLLLDITRDLKGYLSMSPKRGLADVGPPDMAAARDDEGSSGHEAGGSSMEEGRSPREDTPPAPCAAFCGPRACSTLPPNISTQQPQPVTEPKRRRLWGLRGLVKMFRRRVRRRAGESVSPQPSHSALRARSTSELAVDIQHSRSSGGPYNQGLSVSHDSVFTPDTAADGHHSHSTPPALAIATRGVNMMKV
ncbi:uncharacterized protein LOC125047777 [Penaeus chinensis]|uniref:uncharacterized protein LOC125047777 n=1 Tax=Penaeus chinensis TaxID=139456 RepID=UPI001FB6CC6E|nr:uncharacterized protein LOC125047777 [Penaeus chinensis]